LQFAAAAGGDVPGVSRALAVRGSRVAQHLPAGMHEIRLRAENQKFLLSFVDGGSVSCLPPGSGPIKIHAGARAPTHINKEAYQNKPRAAYWPG
jgi:hypothetical protein